MWNSTNPALANDDAFNQFYGKAMFKEQSNVATLQGVVNKTAILATIAIAAGVGGYALVSQYASFMWISWITCLVVTLGIYFVIHGKPQTAVFLGPVYAVVEGGFLGALTGVAEYMLAAQGAKVPGGVALQAFIITGSALAGMLTLYSTGILRPTETFKRIIYTATAAICITYAISFVLWLVGVKLPFMSVFSSGATGPALIGLGINLFVLGIASLWLIIDFGMIEQRLRNESPKYMEWYCGFALLVTLAWIYYEAVKMVIRVASLLNRR
ncbi:MAG TPA: Bax inhibitor-1/YccA family protein [Phycisphaerales bacterium]|nr:Bax inhibitor-1/YccA family protein [Phycisphaerales bacterium]